MLIAFGIVFVAFGLIVVVGQIVSTVSFPVAQRLGLQESAEHTEPLYNRLEHNTARWDLFVTWTLPLAGVLMLLGNTWWPYVALVAGGVYIDTGGRELAKILALRPHGVRMGAEKEARRTRQFLVVLSVVGLLALGVAVTAVTGATGGASWQ